MEHSKHPNYRNENIETEHLNNMQINRVLMLKNSLLESVKDSEKLVERIKRQN